LKQKYRELCVLLHPDKNPDPRAVHAFAALSKAMTTAVTAAAARNREGSAREQQEQQSSREAGGGDMSGEVCDDEIFWVDSSGTISVPAAAKQAPEGGCPSKSSCIILHL
jgi:DnaJ-class molecular chaperone